MFVLAKESLRGNKIVAYFGRRILLAQLLMPSLHWKARAGAQRFGSRSFEDTSHRSTPSPTALPWARIVENIATVIVYLERTSIAQAETLAPAPPMWFAKTT
jgi:hypothetical protein